LFASIGDELSASIGIMKVVTLPTLLVLSAIIIWFLKKNQMCTKYGLCKSEVSASKMLYYIPIVILLTANLWYGVRLNASPLETILYILSMFCVGFLEEIIFRGFLFQAMLKDGEKFAIIVSSVTFGIGHLVNLFNGSGVELLPNLLQVIYAVAVGFLFVLIFYKTKSLWVCIFTHALFNSLSAFSNEVVLNSDQRIISCALISIIAGAYAIYIALAIKEEK
jgi:membrane protease YdiL (CAAX protease family)